MSAVRDVFFDLDGTLVDSRVGITRSINHALDALGEPQRSADDLLWCIGPPLRQAFVSLVGEGRADDGVRLYRERYADIGVLEKTVYDGVPALLAELNAQGLTLHIASSKARVFVERVLKHFELWDRFDGVFGSELDGTRGDKPSLLAYALEQTKADAATSIMVGDRRHDVEGAQANGMPSIGVLYGFGSREELELAGADSLALAPTAVVTWIRARARR